MKTISPNSELQSRPEPLSTGARARIDFAKRRLNRSLDTWRLLNLLRCQTPRFFQRADVVGKWVWIQFQVEPPLAVRQKLAELGFHWKNDAWLGGTRPMPTLASQIYDNPIPQFLLWRCSQAGYARLTATPTARKSLQYHIQELRSRGELLLSPMGNYNCR